MPEKHVFYSSLTQLDSSEWLLAFCRGLVQDQTQNKECVAFLIASETFSSNLQNILSKEEELTKEETTLVLTSIKYGKHTCPKTLKIVLIYKCSLFIRTRLW